MRRSIAIRLSIMVDGKIEALDTPTNLKQTFNASSMEDVFIGWLVKQPEESNVDYNIISHKYEITI